MTINIYKNYEYFLCVKLSLSFSAGFTQDLEERWLDEHMSHTDF